MFTLILFSDRMTAMECLEHKWLYEYSPAKLISPALCADAHNLLNECRSDKPTMSATTHLRNLKNQSDSEKVTTNGTMVNGDAVHDDNNHRLPSAVMLNTSVNDCDNKENILENRNISKLFSNSVTQNGAQHCSSPVSASLVSMANCTSNFILEFVDDSTNASVSGATAANNSSKHQTSLFPDAPTTPKVCRKSSPDSPPSVKTLVKKFQLDAVDCVNVVCSSNGSNGCDSDTDAYTSTTTKITSIKTTVTSNGDDVKDSYTSIGNCSSSSSTAVNTVTSKSCLCGKPTGCCCHLLNCRNKSIVVIDNSIVC